MRMRSKNRRKWQTDKTERQKQKKNQTGAQNGGLADNDFVIVIANFAAVVVVLTFVVAVVVGVTVAVVVADVR